MATMPSNSKLGNWTQSEKDRRALVEQGITVVASQRSDHRLIEWAKSQNKYAKIDRGTKWGNPFVMKLEQDRDSVCDQFAQHFEQSTLQTQITELQGMVLGCWCNPKRCHGDYLASKANGDASWSEHVTVSESSAQPELSNSVTNTNGVTVIKGAEQCSPLISVTLPHWTDGFCEESKAIAFIVSIRNISCLDRWILRGVQSKVSEV